MPLTNQKSRTTVSCAIIVLFFVSLLWGGLQMAFQDSLEDPGLNAPGLRFSPSDVRLDSPVEIFRGFPDFSHYVHLRTITADELALRGRRLIFVGDIHGMKSSIDTLLSNLSYNSTRDILLHLGDFMAKGPDSLEILSQFSDANVIGVRGNHEQTVIEWRGWIEWVESQPGGKKWLEKMERKHPQGIDSKKGRLSKGHRWPIPTGWKFMGDHYKLARNMTESQYSYMRRLPLIIHLPSLNTFAVHAGILPFNPEHAPDAPGQPLSQIPENLILPSDSRRNAQERALITDIEQNTVPWVLLNIRSLLRNGKVSRSSKKGKPWPALWTMVMEQCHGFTHKPTIRFIPGRQDYPDSGPLRLSCLPMNVIYGHTASRGLDIRRWSFGLDTGCVMGRQLTAMLLSNLTEPLPVTIDEQMKEAPFGDFGMAQFISIPCRK